MTDLTPADSKLFFSRQDASDPRLGELVSQKPLAKGVAVIGYPDDEGVKVNGGRTGAARGPSAIRHWLYRMTPHPHKALKTFFDVGDLTIQGELSKRHQTALEIAEKYLSSGIQLLSLGGGNDYAYCDGQAFLNSRLSAKPLIVNIDAHFDVRDLSRGLSSGTPFYRLLESGIEFDFVEVGIQPGCNSQAHWKYVESKGGKILSTEEQALSGQSWLEFTKTRLGPWLTKRPTFLAIDIDAFAWPFAGGASAAWPLGLLPQDFLPLYDLFLKQLDVRVLGIYEVAPELESGLGTAKLAAQLAHMFLHESQ
jgi:formiminoglutamase